MKQKMFKQTEQTHGSTVCESPDGVCTYVLALASKNSKPDQQQEADMSQWDVPSNVQHVSTDLCSHSDVSPFSSANCLASSYVTSLWASRSALFPIRMITCNESSDTLGQTDPSTDQRVVSCLCTHRVWVGQVPGVCQPAAQVVVSTSPEHRHKDESAQRYRCVLKVALDEQRTPPPFLNCNWVFLTLSFLKSVHLWNIKRFSLIVFDSNTIILLILIPCKKYLCAVFITGFYFTHT